MRRFHLFELCDQSWLPPSIRLAGMEFLATAMRVTKLYQPSAKVLTDLLQTIPEKKIIVLGAGSGGGILDIVDLLPPGTQVVLTDIFPPQEFHSPHPQVRYHLQPVDAFQVPPDMQGIRVLYNTFHHFKPTQAQRLIESAVQAKQPIAIFEATERSARGLFITLFVPFFVLGVTPWARPFRWSRLLWTYIIPLVPLGALWDGMVSMLRSHTVEEVKAMTAPLSQFTWDVRILKGPHGERIFSAAGKPK